MKLFVWDLHGTLERGTEVACLKISNRILRDNRYKERFIQEEINALFGKKWRDIFETKILGKEKETYERLEKEAFKHAEDFEREVGRYIQPNHHAEDVLSAIEESAHEQILISNTTEENLERFIDALDIKRFFSTNKRYAITTHDGENPKMHTLKEYLDNSQTPFHDIIVIGDTERDIELTHVSGGVSYLYAHPGRPFKECKEDIQPDYKIRDLRKILRHI